MRKPEVILSIAAVLALSYICGAKTRAVEPQRVKKPEAKFKKLLSPGFYAELTKQSKREYRKAKRINAKLSTIAGDYIIDTYTLTMKNALQPTSIPLWQKQIFYPVALLPILERFLLCDVTIDGNSGYVLYACHSYVQLDTIKRGNNGVWSISHTCEICREYDEKSLRSGQILPNNRLRLVFNGIQQVEVEDWSFAGNSPKLLSKNMPFSQP